MHHQRVLWMILWLLVTQVSSCLFFSYCKPKEKVVLKPIISDGNQTNQPRRIHTDGSKLTDYQTTYAQMFYPTVVYFCGDLTSSKRITRLIVTYLAPPLSTKIHTRAYTVYVYQLSFDDQWLATYEFGIWGKSLTLWRRDNGQIHAPLNGHSKRVTELIFTSDNQFLISASFDTTLIIWSVRTGESIHVLRGHALGVIDCSLTADNQRLLSCSLDGTIKIWSIATGACKVTIDDSIERAKFCTQNQHIITANMDKISLWTVNKGRLIWTVPIIRSTNVLAFDEIRMLLTDWRETSTSVQVWNFATGTCVQTFRDHAHRVDSGFFVQRDTAVVSHDIIDTLCIWGVDDGICTHRFDKYVPVVNVQIVYWLQELETEGLVVSAFKGVHVLAINSGKLVFTFPLKFQRTPERSVRVSFDGQFLVLNARGKISFRRFSHHKKSTHN